MKHTHIFKLFTEGRIICEGCGEIRERFEVDKKETIKTIKRHLKGIEKAVGKLEKE